MKPDMQLITRRIEQAGGYPFLDLRLGVSKGYSEDIVKRASRRLEDFDVIFRIMPRRSVLHGDHAKDDATALHRHRQHRMVSFFPGLGPKREGRMALRFGNIDRN